MADSKENVYQAFVGEAKAYFRLLAFAKKADEEGYSNMASLFRAIAEAEKVHAANGFALLDKIGTTEENLRSSFEKETFVNDVAYPAFLKQAWAENNKEVVWTFTKARNAEERHARLYKYAITEMANEKKTIYYVCQNCGWVEDGKRPEECPNCRSPSGSYKEVA